MTVLNVIKHRFSVRKYKPKPVRTKDLYAILEAARFAQSSNNLQDWRFIIVRNENTRKNLVEATKGKNFVGEAPVVIVCCGINTNHKMTCGQHSYVIDVAIAMENMALVAWERGLGTCWLGAFYEDRVKELLNISGEDTRVVGILTLGYSALSAKLSGKIQKLNLNPKKNRLPLDTIVKYETW
ncbi:MAG: nitroreductase family protein [Candidatus Latescibacteria bacterium]|nr:nitroreductase family protein [Candidatus Latescibacterota bacterium]